METLVDLLNDAAERFGPTTALTIKPGFRQQRWSYLRLRESSERVAAVLRQYGLKKGDRAIIWAPNSPEWVVAFFGCLQAGVVAVPLDVRSAPAFVASIVGQTEPKLAFLSRQTAQGLPDPGFPVVSLEDLEEHLDGVAPLGDEPPVAADDIAEIMFTSGTTGDPKGVVLTHQNVVSNAVAAAKVLPVKPWYRLLSLLPLSHMLEQTGGLLVPLLNGASVVYPVSRRPSIIFKTMQTNHVTNFVAVPQALQLFMNGIERQVRAQGKERQWRFLLRLASVLPTPVRRWLFRQVHRQLGGRLGFIMSGGAYLDPELARRWAALGIPVLQGYGTTETSPAITMNTLRYQSLGSVGRVLPGQEVRIAPDGEILTRGPNVTQGYWQNPEATTASFEDGWYKTGDLGYLDSDGFLYLKGRKKDLIVLANGQNVYPEDIEALLHKESGVADTVIVGLPGDGGTVQVHAVLLMEDGTRAPDVVRSVNRQLASHQQVQGFTLWPEDDFPRTHTLKVKKPLVLDFLLSQQQEPSPSVASDAMQQQAPAGELHRVVASICGLPPETLAPGQTLGLDLNLDSLGRVELLSAIEAEIGVYVDEEKLGPETTFQELEDLVQRGGTKQDLPFPSWGRSLWCQGLRALLQHTALFPLLRVFYKVQVRGRENLDMLEGSVLFASNHNVSLDNPLIMMSLPNRWRRRLCPAAAADDAFGNPFWRVANSLLGNAFPFARDGAVRPSLEHLGQLLDWGWSVLIYPEGYNTYGDMVPFKAGTGLVAVESRTPVVPVRVTLRKGSVFDRASLLSRGEVEVSFGQPLAFPRGTDYREATEQLEAAVKAL